MMQYAQQATYLLAWSVCGAVLLFGTSACDNTIEPFPDTTTSYFSIYGALNTNADTQFVRVTPIRQTFVNDSDAEPSFMVSTIETSSGTRVAWQDSLITLRDGTQAHLFFSLMPVEGGATYQLEVEREDGATTVAETTIPTNPAPLVRQPTGDSLRLTQSITLQGVNKVPQRLAMKYLIAKSETAPPESFDIQYDIDLNSLGGSLPVLVELTRDKRIIVGRLGLQPNDKTLVFKGLEMEVELWSIEWAAPESGFNIRNGVGFFGSIGHFFPTWTLSTDAIRTIGYIPAKNGDS